MSPDFYCNTCDICDHTPHDDDAKCLKQHQEWLAASEAALEAAQRERDKALAHLVDTNKVTLAIADERDTYRAALEGFVKRGHEHSIPNCCKEDGYSHGFKDGLNEAALVSRAALEQGGGKP